MSSRKVISALSIGLLAATISVAQEKAPAKTTTRDNLQAAYNGESNAKAHYEAFAKKADEEGYKGVASLFRAAAASEEVHLRNHAEALKSMGAEPIADIKDLEVKSTRENLETALKGETYEMETMYPGFVKQADAEKNVKAARSFKGAMAAEKEHAKFYKDALDHLESWKAEQKTFLVCTVCGYTTMDLALKQCPVCSVPRDKFLTIQ
jgi:rubrerythrin